MRGNRNSGEVDFELRDGISKFFAQNHQNNSFKVDIIEKDDAYVVLAELPGYKKEDVSASLVDHWLEIAATRNEEEVDEDYKYLRKERSTETLVRRMYLDYAVNEKVNAKLEDGILKIDIPMQSGSKVSSKIEIK